MKIKARHVKKAGKYEYRIYYAELRKIEYEALSKLANEWELESVEGERAIFKAVKRQSS